MSHQPCEKTRAKARAMASVGLPQKDIAKVLGICEKTLRAHYRDVLDTAEAQANAAIGGRLYSVAMGSQGFPPKEQVSAMIFWLKTRAGWRERGRGAGEGEDEPPSKIEITVRPSAGDVKVTRGGENGEHAAGS